MAFSGDFTPVLAKHSKNFNLIHSLEIGVSDMQRNFAPMTEQVRRWRDSQLTDVAARLIIYQAFIEAEIDIPRHLAVPVHKLYFNPEHEEFAPRTLWRPLRNRLHLSSQGAKLDPIPQFRATAKLAPFPRSAARPPLRILWPIEASNFGQHRLSSRSKALGEQSSAPARLHSPISRSTLLDDWGDLDQDDKAENESALKHGLRNPFGVSPWRMAPASG